MDICGIVTCFMAIGTIGPAVLLFLLMNKLLTRFITNKDKLEQGRTILFWLCVVLLLPIIWEVSKSMELLLMLIPLGIWGFAWLGGKILESIISGVIDSFKGTTASRQVAEAAPVVAQHLRSGDYRSARFPSGTRR